MTALLLLTLAAIALAAAAIWFRQTARRRRRPPMPTTSPPTRPFRHHGDCPTADATPEWEHLGGDAFKRTCGCWTERWTTPPPQISDAEVRQQIRHSAVGEDQNKPCPAGEDDEIGALVVTIRDAGTDGSRKACCGICLAWGYRYAPPRRPSYDEADWQADRRRELAEAIEPDERKRVANAVRRGADAGAQRPIIVTPHGRR